MDCALAAMAAPLFLLRMVVLLLPTLCSQSVHSRGYSFANHNGSAPIFATIAKEFWRWRLEQSPEFATTLGVHDYDHRLETFTREAFAHRKEKCEEFIALLDQVDVTFMSEWERNNMAFLREDLQTYVRGYRWSRLSTLNPINHLEGLHKDYSYWLDAMTFGKEEDFHTYIERLRALATQINEQISLMRDAIRLGWTSHRISIDPVIEKLNRLDPRPPKTAFYRPFNDSIYTLGFSSNKIEKLKLQGDVVIYDHVLPAYRKLKYFLTQEYLPNTRPHAGISSLPGGRAFYREVIRWHLSIDLDPEELHQMGRRLVDALRARIDTVRHRVGYIGNLESFMRYTTKTPKFLMVTEQQLLKGYKDIVYKQIRPRLKYIFKNITLMPLEVWAMPFDGPPGVAMPPADDGSMPGIFFVNVRRPHRQQIWRMLALSLHESLPGHHFQACYALNRSIPKYRRVREFRKMFSIPFQFPFQAAYTEGWGVYAETLGRDMGLTNDPFDEYGLLVSDLTNTVRLVADTGIHALRWSRERAIRYYSSKTGEPRHRAEDDIDRFITVPGQALQYKVGHMKIEQLRYRAARRLGAAFDVKEFHDQVLRLGPVSLRTLEHVVDRWLQALAPHHSGSPHHPPPHWTRVFAWLLVSGLLTCLIRAPSFTLSTLLTTF